MGLFLRRPLMLCVALVGMLALTGTWAGTVALAQDASPPSSLRIMAPASPGGGWDQTARFSQRVFQETGIIPGTVEVFNIPGAGGTIGLARLVSTERGAGDLVMITGLVMVGAIITNQSAVDLSQTTPIARLTAEYEVIAVPANSPFQTLDDLLEAFKANPRSISWAGGSAGGVDHILVGLLAKEVGVAPEDVNYIPFSGGGEALAAMLGGHVSAGVTGYGEWAGQIAAGNLRALAITSAQRVPGIDIPTLMEQGINIELANWRGVVAPPGISAQQRDALVAAFDQLHASEAWHQVLADNDWMDFYLSGDAFAQYLQEESARVEAVLREIGLAE
ncbi:MAG: tripartite tricarboxylate transporter substrate binding protein [Limnochordales bacterium]|nr:tripartite tricarboxylate transporter substrate binding protein [Limnochordales bacterium]